MDWQHNGYELVEPRWTQGDPLWQGFATARGVRLPHCDISGAIVVDIPPHLIPQVKWDAKKPASTSEKGALAVRIVSQMCDRNLIPIGFTLKEINERSEQIKGIDARGEILIQIKHDAGCFQRGVFLQTHERNPYGMH